MNIRAFPDVRSTLQDLAETPFDTAGSVELCGPEVLPVKAVPGATHGWFELLVDWGVVGLPVSTMGNLIANWISTNLPFAEAERIARNIFQSVASETTCLTDLT